MTITFNVYQVKEEDVNMENALPFDIDSFIKNEILTLIDIKEFDYCGVNENYIKNGIDKETADKLTKEDKNKSIIETNKLIESKIKQANVHLKSSYKDNNNDYVIYNYNSFVYGAWEAYNKHHHLEIRPENIWMAIMTQFSFYLSKNSEFLRDKFVDFQGKQILEVTTDYPILEAPFDKLTLDMIKQIQKNIKDPSIKDWIVPNFSTTTETDKVIFSIALMSTMKNYFKFQMSTYCGLPKVTLHGTVSDWIDLKEKVQRLIEFDNNDNHMSKWVTHLLPVMDNFIQTANGTPDVNWWNKIVHVHSQSGGDIITGWLSVFCVFNDSGVYEDNKKPHFSEDKIPCNFPRISIDAIANGYVSVPVLLIDSDGTKYNSQLYAGHFTSKIEKSKITPSLDWFMVGNISI